MRWYALTYALPTTLVREAAVTKDTGPGAMNMSRSGFAELFSVLPVEERVVGVPLRRFPVLGPVEEIVFRKRLVERR